jgi:hypothetical protein
VKAIKRVCREICGLVCRVPNGCARYPKYRSGHVNVPSAIVKANSLAHFAATGQEIRVDGPADLSETMFCRIHAL